MRRDSTLHALFHCLMTLSLVALLALVGCGDDGGDGDTPSGSSTSTPTCTVDGNECPNICDHGVGIQDETCSGTTDCGCGLFCKAGACAPYEGDNAGCTCEQLQLDDEGNPVVEDDAGGSTDTDTSGGTGDGPGDDCPTPTPDGFVCNPFCQTGCEEGQACTFSNGAGICFPPGDGDMGDVCSGNSCQAGHTCIAFTGDPQSICRRFCTDDSECGPDRKCSLTVNGLFTVCSEPTVGCDLFGDPASECGADADSGQGCYYSNQASQCMPAGVLEGGDAVSGTCSGGDLSCMVDAQCTACDGFVADADAQSGFCLGTEKVCNSHEECQQCEGYVAAVAETVMGTCSHDGATECTEDSACVSLCEGYVPAVEEAMGSCSQDSTIECAESATCQPTCDGFIPGAPEQLGICFQDNTIECSSDADCGEGDVCTGNTPAGTDTLGACSNNAEVACTSDDHCLPACEGIGEMVPEVKGTCADGVTECSTDGDCSEGVCTGNFPSYPATEGLCPGEGEIVCTTDADCVPTCDGVVTAADAVMGSCGGSATECASDEECGAQCEGYQEQTEGQMGICSDGKDPESEEAIQCTSNADCTQMCDGLIEATNETAGICAYDGVSECTAASPCDSTCEGAVAGGQGDICGAANDCVPGLQCLVVCTDICSLDGSAGIPCSGCPVEFMEINAANNMGICIDENVPAACDLYNQTGCGGGEACYSLRGGHGCLGAGVQGEGTECKFSNDCTGGNLCINSMCMEACNINAEAGAPESCDVKCNGTEPGTLNPAIWGIGFCKDAPPAEPCSFWEQDCTGGKVCYGTALGEACLTPDNSKKEGEGCSRNQDCEAGLVCPSSNSPNGGKCTRPCSVVIPDYDGSMSDCGSHADCPLPESCIGGKCVVPYCADDCPGSAAQPVTTDSKIGTCDSGL